jgi:RNA polymerase sigma factor (sigma-70 family)
VGNAFKESFEAFVRNEHRRLVGALRLYCGDPDTADEIASEALVRALLEWRRVRVMNSPTGWLYRVAFNLVKSMHRRRAAEGRALSKLAREANQSAHDPDVATTLAVRSAVAGLPARQAQAIVCRYYLGLNVEQAAAVLGVTPGSLKVYTSRALANLRRQLASELVEEPFYG